ncbi:glyceraldehyde 3-phosphate dehydrogenase NAD-binding domain-containing protein [Ahrensia marina]|uniref:type I glyceraldehyde-3-phosphate dehydrogenase n=1 Tax=Ahrensia marina TaxID=1514904 RepID=UPI0035D0DA37
MRVLINGFGRIGRTLLRQILSDDRNSDIEVVGINDIAPLETCAYLFRYDSVFGPYPKAVEEAPGALVVEGKAIPFTTLADISQADLSSIDLVLECTGKAKTRDVTERGLKAGAKAILISGPSDAADLTAVLGANDDQIGDATIVSNASCTTNAIAPLLKRLEEALGIARAHITTVHCYTGSQPTVDAPAASLERSRAAAVSMVPTSTSAATQVTRVLPSMAEKLTVSAVRVPCISVSAIDAVLQLERAPDGPMDGLLEKMFSESPLVGLTHDPCVSTDMRARPESLVLAMPETRQLGDHQVRLFGWYDNEWGFSARMIDMARLMMARH